MSRGTTAPVLLAMLLSVVGVAPAAQADRKVESYAVAGPSAITLTGHGYGHGHGLSQYGALGAARSGLTWRQIIEFYYPGTTWSSLGGQVKVLISGDTSSDVQVVNEAGLKVRSLASRRTWTVPAKRTTRWRLVGVSGGRTQVQWKAGGWRTWKTFRGEGELQSRDGILTLVKPGDKASYRGKLRSLSPSPGSAARDTVNVLSLEKYLQGVVPLEMPALWSADAVRAQSVAARTYAAAERSHPSAHHYDLCDTSHCQVYGGYDAEHPSSTQAIKDTAKQGLLWDGRPAFTQFSASNGGWTSAGSQPFLVDRADPYDAVPPENVHHTWTHAVDDVALEKHYPAIGDLTRIDVVTRDGNGEWGGRVGDLQLVGTTGVATLDGDRLRELLGLKSSWFTFTVTPTTARAR
ncbi:SpoIID/LytB domain-containing protein [Nocardioides gansuensis]|uniref:SpoIID/LytB domain-containing protein n=1 Tax=Nocardioides gansuensis TaxID=2138300 RepID=A0A2T8F4N4_9ACTN|nr:SpoIID/LytB domain-containing protein [Nocardioides gansuensis]PVG80675.1 SpoIID/LytB domain-containing protein [Nocardioides gansuensis]